MAALERAGKRDDTWPEILPLDAVARAAYHRGMTDRSAGRMTPTIASVDEMDAYFKEKRRA